MTKLRLITKPTGTSPQASLQPSTRRGPLPPWIRPQQAHKHCPQCEGHCIQACPKSLLARHPKHSKHAHQPWFDFQQDGCDFCGECLDECPVNSSFEGPVKLGEWAINPARCLLDSAIPCHQCINACPQQALSSPNPSPTIQGQARLSPQVQPLQLDPSRCNGCGLCVAPCPTQAIQIRPGAINTSGQT